LVYLSDDLVKHTCFCKCEREKAHREEQPELHFELPNCQVGLSILQKLMGFLALRLKDVITE
jgi:hypothetical protein